MTWPISKNWAVSRNPYNWILQERRGKRWRPIGYYRTPEKLLHGLYEKLLLCEPAEPSLIEHIEHCLTVVEACTEQLSAYIHSSLNGEPARHAQPSPTRLKVESLPHESLTLDLPEPVTK